MTNSIFAHIPFPQLHARLAFFTARKINPEIFFPSESLDAIIPEQLGEVAEVLTAAGLKCTIHAPFMDLSPGSPEPLLRKATLHRFSQVLAAAEILKPEIVVFHPGYDRWRYGDIRDKWLGYSIGTWQTVLEKAAGIGCIIAVENIFEEEPSTLLALLEAVNAPNFRHCFDVGHWNLFNKVGLEEWFAAIGGYIAEAHIHDNRGQRDDHSPLGEGNIDFPLLFRLIKRYAPQAALTIEAHSQEELERALINLQNYVTE